MDKLRLALVYLLTTTTLPSDAEFERIEKTIEGDVGDSLSALRQVLNTDPRWFKGLCFRTVHPAVRRVASRAEQTIALGSHTGSGRLAALHCLNSFFQGP